MSCGVLPNRRTKPRLEWRIASDTARFAALVASRPCTSTPMPISVMQRIRGIGRLPLLNGQSACLHILERENGPEKCPQVFYSELQLQLTADDVQREMVLRATHHGHCPCLQNEACSST